MQLQLLYEEKTGVGQLLRNRMVDFSHNGLLWKFGLAWESKFMDLGITATTPKIHLSAEYFNRISRYTILNSIPFAGQSTGEEINFTFYDEAEPVFNYGAGMEFVFTKTWSVYLSYCSDYSYVPSEISRFVKFTDEASNSSSRADIHHVGGGFILKLKGADITLGATNAWSRESIPRPVDFPDEGESGIFDSSDMADVRWSRWRFIFSFSFPFLKDIQEKVEDKFSGEPDEGNE